MMSADSAGEKALEKGEKGGTSDGTVGAQEVTSNLDDPQHGMPDGQTQKNISRALEVVNRVHGWKRKLDGLKDLLKKASEPGQ